MKKNTLIIILVLGSFSINAQDSKIKLGIKSGINLSKYTPGIYLNNIKLADYQTKIGFYIGGYTNIKISEKIKLQPELLFSTQGTRMLIEDLELTDSSGNTIGIGDFETKINESTISFPINLQYFVNDKFNLEGGIQLGYIINRKEEIIKNPFNQFSGNTSLSNNLNYDKFDLGFNIGLGYALFENIRIHTKYFLGLIERDNSIKPSIFCLGIEYGL